MSNDIFECCNVLIKDLVKEFPYLDIRYTCTLERIDLTLELNDEITITRFIGIKHFKTIETRDELYKNLLKV